MRPVRSNLCCALQSEKLYYIIAQTSLYYKTSASQMPDSLQMMKPWLDRITFFVFKTKKAWIIQPITSFSIQPWVIPSTAAFCNFLFLQMTRTA